MPKQEIRQVAIARWFLQCMTGIVLSWTAGYGLEQASGGDKISWPYPRLATAETRADPQTLAALEKPGKIFFQDDFESPESLKKYFEIRGLKEGRAKLVSDPRLTHSGKGAIQFTAAARDGRESGAGASGWFGPDGYDRVYFRRYVKFAADYDQGNLNHVGGGLAAVAGLDRYRAMGSAGIRPDGDDHFNSAFEPWRDWGRLPAPGYMFLYTYWMDMRRDPDGHYWGNMLGPAENDRIVLQRNRWYCLEHMIQVNDPGKANGELAAWIDGKLYIHYKGFRWRTSAEVRLKRFDIGVYVHQAKKDNTVWYDDVALSTGYIGPKVNLPLSESPAAPAWKIAKKERLEGGRTVSLSEPVLLARSKGYLWFPSLIRRQSGDLLAVMSGGADVHTKAPVHWAAWSSDDGLTWSELKKSGPGHIYDRIPQGWRAIPKNSAATNTVWVVRLELDEPRR